MTDTEKKINPFVVRTMDGVRHSGWESADIAKRVAQDCNAQAEILGIKTRYEMTMNLE